MGQLIPENCIKSIDSLGRITLPKGLRDRMYCGNGDEMEIFTATLDGRQCVCLSKPIDANGELENAINIVRAAGYEVRTIEQAAEDNVLLKDLEVLSRNFYKVVEVNIKEDTYYEVKVRDSEKIVYSGLRKWVNAFGAAGVYADDRERFYKYFDNDCVGKVYYRRFIDGCWIWVCMETFDIDDDIKIMVVRDVEDYIKAYKEQI